MEVMRPVALHCVLPGLVTMRWWRERERVRTGHVDLIQADQTSFLPGPLPLRPPRNPSGEATVMLCVSRTVPVPANHLNPPDTYLGLWKSANPHLQALQGEGSTPTSKHKESYLTCPPGDVSCSCATRIATRAMRRQNSNSKQCKVRDGLHSSLLLRELWFIKHTLTLPPPSLLPTLYTARSHLYLLVHKTRLVLSDKWRRQEYDLWLLEYLDVVVSLDAAVQEDVIMVFLVSW
eukprot:scaffold46723_cov20-Tisochrysis_lutea.AAC.1